MNLSQVIHVIPFSGFVPGKETTQKQAIQELVTQFDLAGTEVYMSNYINRLLPLWTTDEKKKQLVRKMKKMHAVRLHCSYWAEPTDFLLKTDYVGLLRRFGSEENVKLYYGDLTGEVMFHRWIQEYELARSIGASAVTFHLIDYFHIDGVWSFTNSRKQILDGMVYLTQKFLNSLAQSHLLKDGPVIELENAGFGLEYGVQHADDFAFLFNSVNDPENKLRVAWDTNHLLHALSIDKNGRGKFNLSASELTPIMSKLESQFGDNPTDLAHQWVSTNITDHRLINRVSAIHLSDKHLSPITYFENGKFTEPYFQTSKNFHTDKEKEEYGTNIVLSAYDSHEVIGTTLINVKQLLSELLQFAHTPIAILHELKNNELDVSLLKKQITKLR